MTEFSEYITSDYIRKWDISPMDFNHEPWYTAPKGEEWIKAGNRISVGEDVYIHPGSRIGNECSFRKGACIETNVKIGAKCRIGEGSSINADSVLKQSVTLSKDVRIGEKVHIGKLCVINEGASIANRTHLDKDVTIGRGVVIEEDCWIKEHAHLEPNVTIYTNCVIRGFIPSGAVAGSGTNGPVIYLGHSDGYPKTLCFVDDKPWIKAGCRWFELDEAIEHWEGHIGQRRITRLQMEYARGIVAYLLEHKKKHRTYPTMI